MITVPYRSDAPLSALMHDVCRLQRVRLHPDRHVFAKPLEGGGIGPPLTDLSERLGDLDLPRNEIGEFEISLIAKTYADQPPRPAAVIQRAGGGGESGGTGGGGAAAATSGGGAARATGTATHVDVILSSQSAMLYKEYAVVKINKRGVRQPRVLGIDHTKFRNLAPANAREDERPAGSVRDRGLKLLGLRTHDSGTKHAFWRMSELTSVRLVGPEAPRDFAVSFTPNEGGRGAGGGTERKYYRYEAESAQEAAEIVAKLTHLLGMHDHPMEQQHGGAEHERGGGRDTGSGGSSGGGAVAGGAVGCQGRAATRRPAIHGML